MTCYRIFHFMYVVLDLLGSQKRDYKVNFIFLV